MSNDRSYLASLQDYYARHRALPSYASIGELLGLRSKSSVAALVARLKLAGQIHHENVFFGTASFSLKSAGPRSPRPPASVQHRRLHHER